MFSRVTWALVASLMLLAAGGMIAAQTEYAEEVERGMTLFDEQRYDEAMNVFFTLAAMKKHLPSANYYLGRLHYIKGDTGRARADIEAALADSADYADAIGFKAYLLKEEGYTEDALVLWRAFETAVEGQPLATADPDSIILPEEYRAIRARALKAAVPDNEYPMPVIDYIERIKNPRVEMMEPEEDIAVEGPSLLQPVADLYDRPLFRIGLVILFILLGLKAFSVLFRRFKSASKEYIEEKIVPPAQNVVPRIGPAQLGGNDYIDIDDELPVMRTAPDDPYEKARFLKHERERHARIINRLLRRVGGPM